MDEMLKSFKCTDDMRKAMQDARIAQLPKYAPSFLEDAITFQEAFDFYGIEEVARLRRSSDSISSGAADIVMVKWDMPCIFSHAPGGVRRLSPRALCDPTEYDRPTEPRRYSLAQVLCLIAEVSPAFSCLGTRFGHDTALRVCGRRTCCNPYHRVASNVYDARIAFGNRLSLHNAAFEALLRSRAVVLAPKKKPACDAHDAPFVCTDTAAPDFVGRMYMGKHPENGERVYVSGATRVSPGDQELLELECVSQDGTRIGWVPLSVRVRDGRFRHSIHLAHSISASGGMMDLLRRTQIGRAAS